MSQESNLINESILHDFKMNNRVADILSPANENIKELSGSFGQSQTKIIAIVNQKGGCGKTTTAINLASCLALVGHKVLLIDMDPQAQATLHLGLPTDDSMLTLYDVLTKGIYLDKVVQPTNVTRLEMVAANSLLSGAQLEIAMSLGRESILRTAINKFILNNRYDYILMDCSPTLNLVTINALVAASYILVPFQTHYFSLQGIRELLFTIETVQERLNSNLKILGILATLFDKRNKINHEILSQARDYFKDLVFKTIINMNVRLCEAPIYKKPIYLYAPQSQGAIDYWELTRELITRIGDTSATAMCASHNLKYGYISK